MSSLEKAITAALQSPEDTALINKAYLEFIKANFIIPIEKYDDNNEPKVLYLIDNGETFLPVFTNNLYLDQWAKDIAQDILILKLSGVDLLKGLGDNVTVCLDIGCQHYKAFNPAEIARLTSMILKIFK